MNFNNKKLKNDKKSGFTLIEIVLSIFIMSMALVSIFSAFSVIVISTSDTLNQLTATYLAQEGMEIVRNVRDTNWLNMDYHSSDGTTSTYTWLDGGMADWCTYGCVVDYTTTGAASNPIGAYSSGSYLNIDENGFYTNKDEGIKTIFQRKVTILPITDVNGDEDDGSGNIIYHIIKVKVEVFWDKKRTILSDGVKASDVGCGDTNCITTEGTLYNWYNYKTQ